MDIHNDTTLDLYQVQQETAGHKMVVGARQLKKALVSGNTRRVYLAQNADPALTEPIIALCRQNGVSYAWVRNMKDLGQAAGIEVGAAAAAAIT